MSSVFPFPLAPSFCTHSREAYLPAPSSGAAPYHVMRRHACRSYTAIGVGARTWRHDSLEMAMNPFLTCSGGARNHGYGGRSKSFNHKIIECSLFIWIFALWMDSSKDKIQICVILLSRSHQKIYDKAFIISF
jgi:hypothetical protein